MKVIIDRFEGDYAVAEAEDKSMQNILKSQLPKGAKEGDVLIIDGNNIRLDENETQLRKKRIKELEDKLWG